MAKLYIKNTDGTYIPYPSVITTNLDIVQNKGDSLTSAMSQRAVTNELASKQDILIAGDNITIVGNVISSTGGGGGVKRLYVDISGGSITDPEQLASNAALYTEIVTALTNDELPPQVGIVALEGDAPLSLTSILLSYNNPSVMIMFIYKTSPLTFALSSDGNVSNAG